MRERNIQRQAQVRATVNELSETEDSAEDRAQWSEYLERMELMNTWYRDVLEEKISGDIRKRLKETEESEYTEIEDSTITKARTTITPAKKVKAVGARILL